MSFADHVEAHGTRPGRLPIGFPDQLCDREFSYPVDGNEEVQLPFSDLDFRYVEMKESHQVAFEALAFGLVIPRCTAAVRSRDAESSDVGGVCQLGDAGPCRA